MPDNDVDVSVTFKEGTESGPTPDEEATDAGIGDLFDEAVSGSQEQEEDTQQQDSTSENAVTLAAMDDNEGLYKLTEDLQFEEETSYYIEKDDGSFERATVQAGEAIEDAAKYYEKIGAIILSAGKLDPNSTVTITPNPVKDKTLTNLKAVYKSHYVQETEKTFQDGRIYFLIVDGKFAKQTGVKKGEPIPDGKTYYYRSSQTRNVETTITADSTGAYKFVIPDGVTADGIKFIATFGDVTPANQAESQKTPAKASTAQSAGALAAGVNITNNTASVTSTGKITAGGTVTVEAKGEAEGKVLADGTSVDRPDETPADEQNPGGTTPDGSTIVTAEQKVVPYTVYIEPSKGAALASLPESDPSAGKFVLKVVTEAEKSFSADEGKVIFTYTDADGTAKTGTATLNTSNGTYTVDLSGLAIKAGTQVSIKLVDFTTGVEVAGEYLIANTIKIAQTQNGKVSLLSGKAGSAVYAFGTTPATGYTVQAVTGEEGQEDVIGSPYLTYTKKDGTSAKVALTDGGKGNWYFNIAELTDLKEGSEIVISADFVANKLDVNLSVLSGGAENAQAGTITLDSATIAEAAAGEAPAKAIEGKTVKFTVGANASASGQIVKVSVKYTLDGKETVKELKDENGTYSFVMPNAPVTVTADFYNQIHSIVIAGEGKDKVTVNQTNAGAGQTITITLNETDAQAGAKISRVDMALKVGEK